MIGQRGGSLEVRVYSGGGRNARRTLTRTTLGVKLGWIARNPADGATPPPEGSGEPQAPSTEAVVAFLATVAEKEPEIAMFVRLDAVTGMRRAEVCALRRSDVDLDSGVLRKSRSLGMAKGAPYVKGDGFLHAAERTPLIVAVTCTESEQA